MLYSVYNRGVLYSRKVPHRAIRMHVYIYCLVDLRINVYGMMYTVQFHTTLAVDCFSFYNNIEKCSGDDDPSKRQGSSKLRYVLEYKACIYQEKYDVCYFLLEVMYSLLGFHEIIIHLNVNPFGDQPIQNQTKREAYLLSGFWMQETTTRDLLFLPFKNRSFIQKSLNVYESIFLQYACILLKPIFIRNK